MATRLGYVPNLSARALASRRTGLIGVVVDALGEPIAAGVLTGLERRLAAAGHALLVAMAGGSLERRLAATRILLGRGADALLFIDPAPSADVLDLLGARPLPWIALADSAASGLRTIAFGRRRGAILAAQFLLELGHRTFGVLAAPNHGTQDGVIAALAGTGAVFVEAEAANGNLDAAARAMQTLLHAERRPTAIVCGSDVDALAAIRECLTRGIAVPGEMSVVGFGDAQFARGGFPALTTLRIPAVGVGERVADLLLAEAQGAEAAAFEVPIKLVVRESSGPAPGPNLP